MNPTTGAALEEAACAHFLPYLTSTEDFYSSRRRSPAA